MRLLDTQNGYGLISVFFHWTTAALVIGLFASGWYMVELTYYDELYQVLPHWHKSIGMLFVLYLIVRIVWRIQSGKPEPLKTHRPYEVITAPLAQWMMLALLVAIVTTGYLIPTAAGKPIDVFDWISIPALSLDVHNQEDISGELHRYGSYALIALVVLHSLAALKHHFLDKDVTLSRILTINPKGDH